MSPAQYLKELSIKLAKAHILSDYPGSMLDRIQKDVDDGLSQEQSIDDQIGEHEKALSKITEVIKKHT